MSYRGLAKRAQNNRVDFEQDFKQALLKLVQKEIKHAPTKKTKFYSKDSKEKEL